ncbi:MAG: acyltransferase family protein [candidate division Zixibacteria bacterium]|nr:acyltransferase family protein [candidate division Zixibacteria bacterium]
MAREAPVDIAKGIGIILVVAGHTIIGFGSQHEHLYNFTHSFNMPLFLGISVIFISKKRSISAFFNSKFKRFVIPFLSWVVVYAILSNLMNYIKVQLQSVVVINEAITYHALNEYLMIPFLGNWISLKNAGLYVELWFLPAAFSLALLFRFILELDFKNNKIIIAIVSIIASLLMVYFNNLYKLHNMIPWGIDIAITCLPFYYLCQFRKIFYKLNTIFIPILIILIVILTYRMPVGIAGMIIDNYFRFILAANLGIILVFCVSSKLATFRISKILTKIGSRSYLIFTLQGVVFLFWRPLASRISILSNDDLFNAVLFILGLTIPYFLYPVVDKFKVSRFLLLGADKKSS